MSFEQAVDDLRPVYAAWARGDFSEQPAIYDPDMEWGFSGEFPDAELVREVGRRSDLLSDWLSGWDHWRVEIDRYLDAGEIVVALTTFSGMGRGSRVPVEEKGAHVWTMRDGKAIRMIIYADRDRALKAAGIDPGEAGSWRSLPRDLA